MKACLLALVFSLCAVAHGASLDLNPIVALHAQRAVFLGQNRPHTSSCPGTDSFTGVGPLNPACWTNTGVSGYTALSTSNGVILTAGSGSGYATYTGKTLDVAFTVSSASSTTGPMILCNIGGTDNCYLWELNSQSIIALIAGGGGGAFTLAIGPTVSPGDQIKFSATVSAGVPTLTATNVTSGGGGPVTVSDTSACSGSPCSITGNVGVFISNGDKLLSMVAH
jgi:hypothetical protein